MSLQVLVSTMHRMDHSILDKMNINSDAIVVNQCDCEKDSEESFEYKGHRILWLNRNERGVGKSRNLALSYATADIVLFADDDVIYDDDYVSVIEKAFFETNADTLIFRADILNEARKVNEEEGIKRLSLFNCTRYGAYRIACKRKIIEKENITFSLLFGGGAKYGSGEDSVFTADLIKHKCKVYSVPYKIGNVEQSESTWFKGFNEKYCHDKGALMKTLYGRLWYPLMIVLIKRHPEQYSEIGLKKALKYAKKGAAEIR